VDLGARRVEVLALDHDLGIGERIGAARMVGIEVGRDEIGDVARFEAERRELCDDVILLVHAPPAIVGLLIGSDRLAVQAGIDQHVSAVIGLDQVARCR